MRILKHSIFPDPFYYTAINKGEGALSVPVAIPEFTDVFASTCKCVGALSVVFAILDFTDVFVSVFRSPSAKTVMKNSR